MIKLIRITTVPISLKLLITGQMKYMQAKGFDVTAMSSDGKEREEVILNEDVEHIIVPMTRQITPFQDLSCLWQLIKHFRRIRPDIVHTHTPKAGLLGMLAAKITSVPVRIHTVAGLPLMTANGFKFSLLRFIERLTYWGAQHVWPNSQSLFHYIQKARFTSDDKLEIIGEGSSNGIDLKQFSIQNISLELTENIKAKINYQEDLFYCLAVGRIVRDKGIEELVTAFMEVHKSNPHLRLILVGDMEQERAEENLSEAIKKQILEHSAILAVGWSNDVAAYMQVCDLLIHASHREGFPNVLLQAGAMGCPIICSNIPGNIDIVTNGETGQFFEVKNKSDLASKIKFTIKNPEVVKEYSNHLQHLVISKFSRPTIHQAIYDRYKFLLKKESIH